MYCNACKRNIDGDSKFCVYCGGNNISDKPKENNNDLGNQDELIKALKEEKNLSNYLVEEKNKYKISLAVLLPILLISIIMISIFLVINTKNLQDSETKKYVLESFNSSLTEKNNSLSNENTKLESELNALKRDYEILKVSKYPDEESKKNDKAIELSSDKSDNNYNNSGNFTSKEVAFFDKVYNLIGEYNAATNHMNVYHGENWIINDPQSVALEETFLVKLNELSNKMESFSCPDSLKNERDNLVNISKEIYNIRVQEVEFMRNNDFGNYVKYNNLWNDSLAKFINYYNSII